MNFKIFLVIALIILGCKNKQKETIVIANEENKSVAKTNDFDLEVYDFADFEKYLNTKDDKIHVVNFWATWCAPCVKELPYFEKLYSEYKNVDVLLVSLDFPHLYESKLKPFIKKKNIKSKVIALDDVDMNTWIPKVDEAWSGSLPATIIYKNNERKFFERSFSYEELETEVKHFIK